jgi:glycosyltransferase involved in cell wall biosynthesis
VSATKVLYVLHNHPSVQPGGSEAYTLQLYRALRSSGDFQPMIVARAAGVRTEGPPPIGARFTPLTGDPDQYFVQVEDDEYDHFFQSAPDKSLYTRDFAGFLEAHKPDVVHLQHSLFIGFDLIPTIRRVLPTTPIVYTLQEYLPICHNHGQLVRTKGRELCLEASPRRCHECFPEISQQDFFLRKRLIQSQLSEVDLFIAPSRFLLERYVDWGIARERIRHEDYGFPPVTPPADETRARNSFAFFGVITPFKGMDVLLHAMHRLGPDFSGRLVIHGAEYQAEQAQEEYDELQWLLAETSETVTFSGPYDHDRDLPGLMAETDWVVVPSLWWENSPLVIAEAFQHGRPVIASDIGGMAEKIAHGVNGLQFRVGDVAGLAETMRRAATTIGLWDTLHEGIGPVNSMEDHVAVLREIYGTLMEKKLSWS